MPPTPRVSIVVPVFNDEATVAATLESCLAQALPDVEIICVDDASTDDTPEIVNAYAQRDARVRVIRHRHNRSAFQARRAGIDAASAAYLLFVDGDDELHPEAAEKTLAAAHQHDADLVGFATEVIGSEGRTIGGYQSRLAPKHTYLTGSEVLAQLFPIGQPAQGQLWRYLFRTAVLRDAYALLPKDLVLPRVNDLPLMYLAAVLASRYVSIPDRLYRYHFGRGGSGRTADSLEQVSFYAEAIRSIESIEPAIEQIGRTMSDATSLLDNYESVRLSIIGYVCTYLLKHTPLELRTAMLDELHERVSATDLVVAAVKFYPECLSALKEHSAPVGLGNRPVRNVLLTTRKLTTGGVSGVLLAQAHFLMQAGYNVTIVARRYGSDPQAAPRGATFIEMVGQGLADRLTEWAGICRAHEIDVVIDHQVLYSRDWPEYALIARGLGVANIGWMHNFAGRPIYDLNGLHELLKANIPLLETLVTLSPLDVAFWKLRGMPRTVFIPNPPSPLMLESADHAKPKQLTSGRLELIWWGRLDEHTKQMRHLIDVAGELRRLNVDFYLTVIGPDWGDWTAQRFNNIAHKRGLDGYVQAVGERHGQELIEAIDAADAFVTTSIIEGYQLTIAEAQIRGLPVFMYELPWLTLAQDNGGIIAVSQGDAAALAQQIAAVAKSPAAYAELSRAAIDAAGKALAYDFSQLYEQVITGSLPPEFSPEPTLADAKQLLDLTIFYAERHAGLRSPATVGGAARGPAGRRGSANRAAPSSLGQWAWRTAKPLGRTVLQLFPRLRPLAHRAKRTLVFRQH